MAGILHFETFLLTGILLNLTPGNDTIFILSRSIAMGRKAGVLSVLGIATGSLIHTTMAALGLSVIIAKSLLVFNVLKYAGAAYLVFIGIKMLVDRSTFGLKGQPGVATTRNWKRVYRDAVLTNVLNPKVAMFFIAFLPQFVEPAYPGHVIPLLLLGTCFTITGTAWCMVLALFSASIAGKLKKNPRFSFYLNKVCGAVLVGLGIKLGLTNKQ